jgi:hypothetical protein
MAISLRLSGSVQSHVYDTMSLVFYNSQLLYHHPNINLLKPPSLPSVPEPQITSSFLGTSRSHTNHGAAPELASIATVPENFTRRENHA